jgi:hypothetical protein
MPIAVLDKNGVLIGRKKNGTGIECGDLPINGRYVLQEGAFIPVGKGQGKPKPRPVSRDHATYLALRAILNGTPIPQECRDWCDWYERHGK